jgi:Domain of unknown function (DUF4965)/Domain of unknown function (DUF1793)
MSEALDKKIERDSVASGGSDLAMITSAIVRQSFGATQLVGTQSKPFLLMKEISTGGNVQTVDVLYSMHPILLYCNPTLLKLMLDPLFEQQEAGLWPHTFAIHDLGSKYPIASGHTDGKATDLPIDDGSSMIIMSLAYAQRSGDYEFLAQHYGLLRQWTQLLVDGALTPTSPSSADRISGGLYNQTNLALKGIIGIKAMSEIAKLTNHAQDSTWWNDIATRYIGGWQRLGISLIPVPHSTLHYGNPNSYGLLFNLWSDLELGLNLVPREVYEMQSAFYPTKRRSFGVPLDMRFPWTKSELHYVLSDTLTDSLQRTG